MVRKLAARFNFNLPPELKEKIEEHALHNHQTSSQFLRFLIADALAFREELKPRGPRTEYEILCTPARARRLRKLGYEITL